MSQNRWIASCHRSLQIITSSRLSSKSTKKEIVGPDQFGGVVTFPVPKPDLLLVPCLVALGGSINYSILWLMAAFSGPKPSHVLILGLVPSRVLGFRIPS
jgi:hypothetical protein